MEIYQLKRSIISDDELNAFKMTRPRLSICIATYNRAEYVGQTLESIISQLTDEVEIVVADGASTDATQSVVEGLAQRCRQINYVRLPTKGGVDADYCKAVEVAQGEYCWLFTDDDLLNPGAVSAVLDEISKRYSLVIVNARVMNKDFSKTLDNKRLQIDTNETYSESQTEQLFNRIFSYLSFIGCVVINRDLWMQREKKRYLGTEFIHVGMIFQASLPAPALVIAEPYITIRHGNAQWTPRAFEIWLFKWPNLIVSLATVPEQIRQKYQKMQSWNRLRTIITYRAMGAYSLKGYHKWFASNDLSLWWRLITWFIAVIPACIVNLLMLAYFKIMLGLAALFMAIMPACIANMSMLSYFKKLNKGAPIDIYCLEINENNIMNIVRRKILKQSHK